MAVTYLIDLKLPLLLHYYSLNILIYWAQDENQPQEE